MTKLTLKDIKVPSKITIEKNDGEETNFDKIVELFKKHFYIVKNTLEPIASKSVTYKAIQENLEFKDYDEITEHEVVYFLKRKYKIAVSIQSIRELTFVKENQKLSNPVIEYLESIKKKWNPSMDSEFNKLMKFVKFSSEFEGDYDLFCHKYLKKWLINYVANCLGKARNDVMLLMQGSQGIGKSQFLKFFFFAFDYLDVIYEPNHPLRNFTFIPQKKDAVESSLFLENCTRKMSIVFDDMVGFSDKNLKLFRNILSSTTIQTRVEKRRLCSFAATANDITLSENERRLLILKIDSIDKQYIKEIDIDTLIAEMIYHVNETPRDSWKFTYENYTEIMQRNEVYMVHAPVALSILKHFTPVEKTDLRTFGVNFVNSKFILDVLKNNSLDKRYSEMLTPEKISNAMKNLGFISDNQRCAGIDYVVRGFYVQKK